MSRLPEIPERVRLSLGRLAAVLGLCGVAIAQPLLDVFGDSPATFRFLRIDGAAIVWFALVVALVPPLVLWLVGVVADLVDRRAGLVAHLATVAVLLVAIGIQFGKELGLDTSWLLALTGLAVATAGTWAYQRFDPVALWARVLALLPVATVALFLLASPTGELVNQSTLQAVDLDVDPDEPLPSVVMIMLDELPTQSIVADDGGVDASRFPALAAFAEDATWYRRHTTVAPFTQMAVPSMLTGQDPTGGDPFYTEHPDNLFTLLGNTHHLTVSEALTKLCGLETCAGYDPVPPPPERSEPEPEPEPVVSASGARVGDLYATARDLWWDRVSLSSERSESLDDFEEQLAAYDDTTESVEDDPIAPRNDPGELDEEELDLIQFVNTRASTQPVRHGQFLDAIRPSDEPVVYFFHLTLPHSPWRFRPDGTTYSLPDGDASPAGPYNEAPWIATLNQQRHLLQATYTDGLLGSLLADLQAAGAYDDAVVVVASDHGVDFEVGEHHRELSDTTIDGVAYAPLLVKAPGQTEGRIDDSNIISVDILPTIADLLGVELPWSTDGHAAGSSAIEDRGTTKYFYDYTDVFDPELSGVVEFDDDEAFEELLADRFPGIDDPDDPLAGLYEGMEGADLLGRSFDEVTTGDVAGEAEVANLERLDEPPPDEGPLGVIAGQVSEPDGRPVVVALDDVIVGVSPTYDIEGREGVFTVLLPGGVVADDDNEVRIGLVDPSTGRVDELDVDEG